MKEKDNSGAWFLGIIGVFVFFLFGGSSIFSNTTSVNSIPSKTYSAQNYLTAPTKSNDIRPTVFKGNNTPITPIPTLFKTYNYNPYESSNFNDDIYVQGYYRKDGTYVKGHYKTKANDSKKDNYSYKGNTNPYTGKKGYKK